jgi:hypothetical protein
MCGTTWNFYALNQFLESNLLFSHLMAYNNYIQRKVISGQTNLVFFITIYLNAIRWVTYHNLVWFQVRLWKILIIIVYRITAFSISNIYLYLKSFGWPCQHVIFLCFKLFNTLWPQGTEPYIARVFSAHLPGFCYNREYWQKHI